MAEPPLPILYQDDHLVAIHKPSGLLVHRTALDFHERRFALQMLREQLGRRVYPVHRLDKGTSGLLLFALEPDVGRMLNAQFGGRRVEKAYLAVVRGLAPASGEIDYALVPRLDDFEGEARERAPQPSFTRFRRLAGIELPYRVDRYPTTRYSLLALEPTTGRRHQLRRHLKHLSHPIIGDATYGKGRHNRLFQTLFGCSRLLLASMELRFAHPITGEDMNLNAPLAGDFAGLLQEFGWAGAVPAHWLRKAGTLPGT